jgi:hypothetical protein
MKITPQHFVECFANQETLGYNNISDLSWMLRGDLYEFIESVMEEMVPNGDPERDEILDRYNGSRYFAARCLIAATKHLRKEVNKARSVYILVGEQIHQIQTGFHFDGRANPA